MVTQGNISINTKLTIPLYELSFRFSRSGGPGGQHVNRSETKVELLFDVTNSPTLDELQRVKIRKELGHLIDQKGVLHLTSEETRSQHQNRDLVVARFQFLLQEALRPRKKRKRTRPSAGSIQRRLDQKRRRSKKKQDRKRVDW